MSSANSGMGAEGVAARVAVAVFERLGVHEHESRGGVGVSGEKRHSLS